MSPRILIVDDMPMNIMLLEQILRSEGFQTSSAPDGLSAVEISRAETPDLILLDIMMPGTSGFDTCSLLKSDPHTVDIPVIFLSALDDVKSKVQGFKIGGVDYISKPVHGEEVLARVRVHLRIGAGNRAKAEEHKALLGQFREAQQAILVHPADCPEATFSVLYEPLEQAGGDFYDVVAVKPGVHGYFVADVSGHGVSAAFLTAAIKALLRQYTGPLFSPEETMRGVDAVMRQMLGEEQYLTACYAHLNRQRGKLSIVSAGHPPAIVVRKSGAVETLEMDSSPLGMFSNLVLQHREIKVSPGDRIFIYTDGLIESPGQSRADGIARLIDACFRHRDVPRDEAVSLITSDCTSGAERVQDDLLLLGIEVTA